MGAAPAAVCPVAAVGVVLSRTATLGQGGSKPDTTVDSVGYCPASGSVGADQDPEGMLRLALCIGNHLPERLLPHLCCPKRSGAYMLGAPVCQGSNTYLRRLV